MSFAPVKRRWLEASRAILGTSEPTEPPVLDCTGVPINFYESAVKPPRASMPSDVRYQNITKLEARAVCKRVLA